MLWPLSISMAKQVASVCSNGNLLVDLESIQTTFHILLCYKNISTKSLLYLLYTLYSAVFTFA